MSLTDLLDQETQDEILASLIAELQAEGLPTSDWSETSPDRAFLEIFAAALAERNTVAPQIAGGVLLEHPACAGAWLTLVAREFYGLTRNAATRSVRRVRLTNASTTPYTIVVGQFWMRGNATGNLYVASDVGGGVVAAGGGTLDIEVTSEFVNNSAEGYNYTDAQGTIDVIATPRPGLTGVDHQPDFSDVTLTGSDTGTVTPSGTVAAFSWVVKITLSGTLGTAKFRISKDGGSTYAAEQTVGGGGVYGPDADGLILTFAGTFTLGDEYSFTSPGTSVITQGTDEESDDALKIRCRARWPSLSLVPTLTVYEALARNASSQVTRSKAVTSTTILNVVDIYIAGQAGAVGPALVNEVQAYIDVRAPETARPTVASATTLAINLLGTITIQRGYTDAALAAAQILVDTYLNTSMPLGGVIRWSEVYDRIKRQTGVLDLSRADFTINGGFVNITLGSTQVPLWVETLSSVLTIVEV